MFTGKREETKNNNKREVVCRSGTGCTVHETKKKKKKQ